MSSDQQYPYGEQSGQTGQGGQYGGHQQPNGHQQGNGQHRADGQPQPNGQPQPPYDEYGRYPQGQAPYDPAPRAPSYPEPAYPDPSYPDHAYQNPAQDPSFQDPSFQDPSFQDPGTQTWQGQTWDTQYQPQIQPLQPPPAQPQPRPQPRHAAAADTAYLPPQGGYPLPPEVPSPSPVAPAAASYEPYEPPTPPHAAPPQATPSHAAPPYGAAPQATPPQAAGASAAAPFADPSAAAGYSSPTTMGNTRVTDAQRARAEGRSPIIPPGMQPAGLTAALGLLLAGGAAVGPYALVVPLVILQAVTAAGWFRLNGMWPARQGIALAFLGGLVSDVALLAAGKENAPAAIIGTLGVWVLLTVVLQLRSHAGGDERMQGLMATVASAALAIIVTGHLAAPSDAVVVGGIAVAAATVARALPLPAVASVVVALLVSAGAGIAVGGFTDLGSGGALLGLGAGVCALIGLRAASYDYPSRFVHMTAGVALPLAAAAPAVYLLGRALT
ncbi:hypothetical protein [Streptomyces sp. NBC_00370]|uniref:hypothetical protein n=1 Tax=Streptomyces sp. NBC_00370 TaxID=2975728 RepID=UPI002E26F02E